MTSLCHIDQRRVVNRSTLKISEDSWKLQFTGPICHHRPHDATGHALSDNLSQVGVGANNDSCVSRISVQGGKLVCKFAEALASGWSLRLQLVASEVKQRAPTVLASGSKIVPAMTWYDMVTLGL